MPKEYTFFIRAQTIQECYLPFDKQSKILSFILINNICSCLLTLQSKKINVFSHKDFFQGIEIIGVSRENILILNINFARVFLIFANNNINRKQMTPNNNKQFSVTQNVRY